MISNIASSPVAPRNTGPERPPILSRRSSQPGAGGVLHFIGPVLLSLIGHAVVIMLFAGVTWAVGGAGHNSEVDYDAKIVTSDEGRGSQTGFQFAGQDSLLAEGSSRKSNESQASHDLASLLEKNSSPSVAPANVGGGLGSMEMSELSRTDILGTGMGGGGAGSGDGSGFGQRDLGAGGPVGSLWGVGKGQRARSIVYVLDRSGSMSDTFALLQRELRKAIGSLEADQLFNVIWFSEGDATMWSPRLQKATMENKREAFAAIGKIVPAGQTEPVDAIRRGLGQHPDVLFLLSDGDFGDDNERIIKLVSQKSKNRRTIINTILFVYDTMGEGERVLRSIAEKGGGSYKHVTEKDASY